MIISDEEVKYDTQEHNYDVHASGIRWNTNDVRKVLTTRKDGAITITKVAGQPAHITTVK